MPWNMKDFPPAMKNLEEFDQKESNRYRQCAFR